MSEFTDLVVQVMQRDLSVDDVADCGGYISAENVSALRELLARLSMRDQLRSAKYEILALKRAMARMDMKLRGEVYQEPQRPADDMDEYFSACGLDDAKAATVEERELWIEECIQEGREALGLERR